VAEIAAAEIPEQERIRSSALDASNIDVALSRAMLGERLRAARKKEGLTQERLAELSNTSRMTIQRVEKHGADPCVSNVTEWARHCKVSADYLLGFTSVPYAPGACCASSDAEAEE
jgi:DNA-binding XRE family transcriptional regulator